MGFGTTFCRKMHNRCFQYAVRSTYELFPWEPKPVRNKPKAMKVKTTKPKVKSKEKPKETSKNRAQKIAEASLFCEYHVSKRETIDRDGLMSIDEVYMRLTEDGEWKI